MCINSYNVLRLPTSSGSGVMLRQCGFVQERNHWIVPTHLQALRVQLLVVSDDLGFVLRGQTLHHRAVLTRAVPAVQPYRLYSSASHLTWVWCLLPTVTAGSWRLGFCVLTSLKSHRKARNPHLSQGCWTGQLFVDEKLEYDGWELCLSHL